MRLENSFGDILRNHRIKHNLTLREVAEKLDIDTSTLGKLEKNSRKPSIPVLKKISKIFNINYKDLNIALHSDLIASNAMILNEDANEVLKVAEKKVKYLETSKFSKK